MQLDGRMLIGDTEIHGLELIWSAETGSGFGAHVYSGSGAPLNYLWSRVGHAKTGMDERASLTTPVAVRTPVMP
ncbi:hypothetical protein [Nocardia rhizosphaerihabitans]|uniref:Uncharacterized protein n=1 Tax=Nocardia rhizosphaerihabitans TaxID=1691570 RepID=A0ABQ2KDT2_9NOCA|nr:hypothetical protein [Nocardia rhizosphaerihabitans]GGN80519.1 hypothetical protein GCM10011610_29990 [Nocardia rhizosphaerihabitans]